jgi:phytoene/squalene synthetase
LANFCQDVPVDYRRGRIYLPADEMRRFDCREEELGRPNASGPLRTLLEFQVTRAEQFLRDGVPLSQQVPRWLTVDLEMFVCGGLAILASIRRLDYDVLARRPTVSRWQQLRMLWSARFGRSPAGWSAR